MREKPTAAISGDPRNSRQWHLSYCLSCCQLKGSNTLRNSLGCFLFSFIIKGAGQRHLIQVHEDLASQAQATASLGLPSPFFKENDFFIYSYISTTLFFKLILSLLLLIKHIKSCVAFQPFDWCIYHKTYEKNDQHCNLKLWRGHRKRLTPTRNKNKSKSSVGLSSQLYWNSLVKNMYMILFIILILTGPWRWSWRKPTAKAIYRLQEIYHYPWMSLLQKDHH